MAVKTTVRRGGRLEVTEVRGAHETDGSAGFIYVSDFVPCVVVISRE